MSGIFYHVAKQTDERKLLSDFKDGLKPIGRDTGDSDQKQQGGLYFYATAEGASSHVDFLTNDKTRESDRSEQVGKIEFSVPMEKITFPDFRFDIERNKIRALFAEQAIFLCLDTLNSPQANELKDKFNFGEGIELLEICKQKRPYIENNEKKKDDVGDCLCFRVKNQDGNEEIRRAGVADVENTLVWLAENYPDFKKEYSKFMRNTLSNENMINHFGLAFKYCGKENLEVDKITLISKSEKTNTEKEIFNRKNMNILMQNKLNFDR